MNTRPAARRDAHRSLVACLAVLGCAASFAVACDEPTSPSSCGAGFTFSGEACVDVDECALTPTLCGYGASCSNTSGSYVCFCGGVAYGHEGCPDLPPCVPESDPDPDTRTFTIHHLGVPANDGFNLDGLNHAPRPGGAGANEAGCFVLDAAGGIDNGLDALADSLDGTLDLRSALQTILDSPTVGSGTAPVSLTITIGHLAEGDVPNDTCVSVDLHTVGLGVDATAHGRGAITDNVLFALFSDTVTFPVAPAVPDAACDPAPCAPGTLALRLFGARARLYLNDTHATLEPPSVLGGAMFVSDPGATYAAVNAEGWLAAAEAWEQSVGVSVAAATALNATILDARDLHLTTDGFPASCSTTAVANSLSAALSLDSL